MFLRYSHTVDGVHVEMIMGLPKSRELLNYTENAIYIYIILYHYNQPQPNVSIEPVLHVHAISCTCRPTLIKSTLYSTLNNGTIFMLY